MFLHLDNLDFILVKTFLGIDIIADARAHYIGILLCIWEMDIFYETVISCLLSVACCLDCLTKFVEILWYCDEFVLEFAELDFLD